MSLLGIGLCEGETPETETEFRSPRPPRGASPRLDRAAAAASRQSSEGSAGSTQEDVPREQSWKVWAGRRDGDTRYRFGDLTSGILSQVQAGVREVKHTIANKSLAVKEETAHNVTSLVKRLASDQEDADPSGPDGHSASAGEEGCVGSLERWWYDSCMAAHAEHRPELDPPSGAPPKGLADADAERKSLEARVSPAKSLAAPSRSSGARARAASEGSGASAEEPRGMLEVQVLSIGSEACPVHRVDGRHAVERAAEPVCQLTLESRLSGALHPANWEYASEEGSVSTARFTFQEIAGSDLRVNVFDQAYSQFKMGFEEKGFCGGAFVPMSAILRKALENRGGLCGWETSPITVQTEMTVSLLPLSILRRKRKLEAADISKETKPEEDFGHVLLGLKLQLHVSPLLLHFEEPVQFIHFEAETSAKGDPLAVLQSAAAAVARTGRVLNVDPWLTAMDELREDIVTKAVLFAWWSYAALWAPIWLWPLLLVAVLALLSLRMSTVVRSGARTSSERLYVDEIPSESNKNLREQAQDAMKGVAKVQMTIASLAENLSVICSKVEKVKYIIVVGDTVTSVICGIIAVAFAAGLSALLRLVLLLSEVGCWHYLVWLTGCLFLLPRAWRQALADLEPKIQALVDRIKLDDKFERRLMCFWKRIPDGVEACHLDLCRRYVLPGIENTL